MNIKSLNEFSEENKHILNSRNVIIDHEWNNDYVSRSKKHGNIYWNSKHSGGSNIILELAPYQ